MDDVALIVRQQLIDDFPFYAEHCLKIRTKKGDITPFDRIKPAQQLLLDAVARQKECQGYVRILILKARQQGFSTATGGMMFQDVTQRTGAKALVMAHKKDATDTLFEMTQRFYKELPDPVKPSTKYASKRQLYFDLLDSSYIVATAGGEAVARSETLTHFHGSEVAFWPKGSASEIWNGIRQTVADVPGTFIVLESTANGCSGLFFTMCQQIFRGELPDWEVVFSPWFIEPDYRVSELPKDWKRRPDEEIEAVKYGLDDYQLAWRRARIAETSLEQFQQEYPANPEEAFLASGLPVFNPEQLVTLLQNSVKPAEISRYELEGDDWYVTPRGRLKVYHKPDPKEFYVIGADVGKGIRGADYSVAQVLDSQKRVVASWRGWVVSDEFGRICAKLGKWYNWGLLCVEKNDHGILTNFVLQRECRYPNLYIMVEQDKEVDKFTEIPGFITNAKTRPMIIDELRASMRKNEIKLWDQDTIEEMMTFVVAETGKMQADEGRHDDCVIALCLANHAHYGIVTPSKPKDTDYFESYW